MTPAPDDAPTVREEILNLVRGADRPLTPQEITAGVSGSYGYVRKELARLVDQGALRQPKRGHYVAVVTEQPPPPRDALRPGYRTEEDYWAGQAREAPAPYGAPPGFVLFVVVLGPNGAPIYGLDPGGRQVQLGPPLTAQAALSSAA